MRRDVLPGAVALEPGKVAAALGRFFFRHVAAAAVVFPLTNPLKALRLLRGFLLLPALSSSSIHLTHSCQSPWTLLNGKAVTSSDHSASVKFRGLSRAGLTDEGSEGTEGTEDPEGIEGIEGGGVRSTEADGSLPFRVLATASP